MSESIQYPVMLHWATQHFCLQLNYWLLSLSSLCHVPSNEHQNRRFILRTNGTTDVNCTHSFLCLYSVLDYFVGLLHH